MSYLPEAPIDRPEAWAQIEWTQDKLYGAFQKIYNHRSKALHDGIPFPAPMCEAPHYMKPWKAVAEKPMGLGGSVYGGQWLIEDTPMHLSTFEYIARHAILKWWESL